MSTPKVVENGMVAVLVSPGYGAGFASWNSVPGLETHPTLVNLVRENRHAEITDELVHELFSEDYICLLGVSQLRVEWVPEGDVYIIEDYDGNEQVRTQSDIDWTRA